MKHRLDSLGEILEATQHWPDAAWLGHAQFHVEWCLEGHQQKAAYPIGFAAEDARSICLQYFGDNRNHLVLERAPQLWSGKSTLTQMKQCSHLLYIWPRFIWDWKDGPQNFLSLVFELEFKQWWRSLHQWCQQDRTFRIGFHVIDSTIIPKIRYFSIFHVLQSDASMVYHSALDLFDYCD